MALNEVEITAPAARVDLEISLQAGRIAFSHTLLEISCAAWMMGFSATW